MTVYCKSATSTRHSTSFWLPLVFIFSNQFPFSPPFTLGVNKNIQIYPVVLRGAYSPTTILLHQLFVKINICTFFGHTILCSMKNTIEYFFLGQISTKWLKKYQKLINHPQLQQCHVEECSNYIQLLMLIISMSKDFQCLPHLKTTS